MLARYDYICGAVGLVLLAIPALLPASLSETNGAKIWIRLPGFSIQPAEFSKILLLIFFAAVLVAKRNLFTSAGQALSWAWTCPAPATWPPCWRRWIVSVGVMVFEKDLGTSLLLYASFLVMVYIATDRFSWVVIGLGLFAAGSVVAYYLFGHVRVRVQNLAGPVRRLLTAPATRWCSRCSASPPAGSSAPGWETASRAPCPAASTDFIIAVVGEELGPGRAGRGADALHDRDRPRACAPRSRCATASASCWRPGWPPRWRIQLFIVVGGVTELIPLTGLTTPWMSYGGSSLVANYLLLAILIRISHAARAPRSTSQHDRRSRPLSTEVIEPVMNTSLRRVSTMVMTLIVLPAGQRDHHPGVHGPTGCARTPATSGCCSTSTPASAARSPPAAQLLAYSLSTSGHYRFLRVYPEPVRLRAGDRLLLAAILQRRPGARRGPDPQRLRRAAVRSAAGRLLHRPRSSRRQRRHHAACRGCSRPPGTAMQQGCDGGCKGSVVALEPSTGKILAMVSTPSYDPNLLASHDTDEQGQAWQQLRDEPGSPLTNRAISETLPARVHLQGDHHRSRTAGRR